MDVLQRPQWYGQPKELGDLFRLTKGSRVAKAVIVTHQFGSEVRLFIGTRLEIEAVQSRVCRTEDEVFTTAENWRAAMCAKGWA
jgi:hypothetical protein